MVSLNVLFEQYLLLSAAPTACIRLRPAIIFVSLLTIAYNKIMKRIVDYYFSDYGYYRHLESGKCLKDEKFKTSEFDICYMGHEEEIVTEG